MDLKEYKKKRKMQLTVTFVMLIIITAWILNLKNSFEDDTQANSNLKKLELNAKNLL